MFQNYYKWSFFNNRFFTDNLKTKGFFLSENSINNIQIKRLKKDFSYTKFCKVKRLAQLHSF